MGFPTALILWSRSIGTAWTFPTAIPCWWYRPKLSTLSTWRSRFGPAPISKSKMTPPVGILRRARLDKLLENPMRRTFPFYLTMLFGVVVYSQACFGQGGPPAGARRPAPGFDLSGYWTAAMHEDAFERGGGPETADYGGFPPHQAGRLFW